jgi:hypothetical protein
MGHLEYRGYGSERVTDVRARLLANVRPEDRGYLVDGVLSKCLIWLGEKDRDGYGRIKRKGKYVQVHWVLAGDPPAGMEKDHLCHQRDCVRPAHLKDVTRAVNNKNRRATGKVPNVLTPGDIVFIQNMFATGAKVQDVMKATGFSRSTIQKVKRQANDGP